MRTERIAIVGASGAVGREALRLLAERGLSADRVTAFTSDRSAGSDIAFGRASISATGLDADALAQHDVAIFCAASDVALRFAPDAVNRGVRVIDNSSAFRHHPDVPLVIPEVNGEALQSNPRLVANPNCSTILMLVALEPLRKAFGIDRVIVSTYQAVSGAGLAAMKELENQTRDVLNGAGAEPRVFPEPCAFNVFSHESPIDEATGANEEETKLIRETQRIWSAPDAAILPTCVRVPVVRSHSQSITVALTSPATESELRSALEEAPGVKVLDDRERGVFPTPLRATGGDDVLIGRLRRGYGEPLAARTHCMWVCGDQLRKGAALNAIQIAGG